MHHPYKTRAAVKGSAELQLGQCSIVTPTYPFAEPKGGCVREGDRGHYVWILAFYLLVGMVYS